MGRGPRSSRPLAAILVVGWMAALAGTAPVAAATGPGAAAPASRVLRLWLTETNLAAVDRDDARAAVKVWMDTLIKEFDIDFEVETDTIRSVRDAIEGIRLERFDALGVTTLEYLLARDHVRLRPFALGTREAEPGSVLQLVVRKDGPVADLRALKGRTVVLHNQSGEDLPRVWLDTLLLREGLPPARRHCLRVETVGAASKTVLPVFFGKSAACVVSAFAYGTMVELNPQVGRELKVLHRSARYPTSVLAFREGYYAAETRRAETFRGHAIDMHRRPQGRQVLTLFRLERLQPFEEGALRPVEALLAEHARLLAAYSSSQ